MNEAERVVSVASGRIYRRTRLSPLPRSSILPPFVLRSKLPSRISAAAGGWHAHGNRISNPPDQPIIRRPPRSHLLPNLVCTLVGDKHRGIAPPSAGITGDDHKVGSSRYRRPIPGARTAEGAGASREKRTIGTTVVERLERMLEIPVLEHVSVYQQG